MRVPVAIALKDAALMRRDMTALFFTVFFPLIVGVLFGAIFARAVTAGTGEGGIDPIPIGVVDLDQSTFSRRVVAALEAREELEVRPLASEDEADDAVRRRAIPAAIVLGEGLDSALEGLLTGERLEAELVTDPSRGAENGLVVGVVTQVLFEQAFGALGEPQRVRAALARAREALAESDGATPLQRAMFEQMIRAGEGLVAQGEGVGADAFAFDPIALRVRAAGRDRAHVAPRSAFEITIPQAAAWALLGCVTGFGASIVRERQGGTLDRLVLAPVARWQVLAGKALGCFATALVVQAMLFALGIGVLGVRPDSYLLLAVAVVCSCAGFVGVMMVLAVLSGTSDGADGLTRGALIVMAMLGGAGVPLAFMPGWLQLASGASPFKWVILALEGAVWREATMGEVLVPCGVLLAIGVGGVCIGAWRMRWEP